MDMAHLSTRGSTQTQCLHSNNNSITTSHHLCNSNSSQPLHRRHRNSPAMGKLHRLANMKIEGGRPKEEGSCRATVDRQHTVEAMGHMGLGTGCTLVAMQGHTVRAVVRTGTRGAQVQTVTGVMCGARSGVREAAISMSYQRAWMKQQRIRSQLKRSCSRQCHQQCLA